MTGQEETKRFRVRGPLSGRPTKTGEFVMVIRGVGDRPGWWIGPEVSSFLPCRTRAC